MGTRPEAIKIAPVASALAERGLVPLLVFTGQHEALDPADHGLATYPAIRLDCPALNDPHLYVEQVSKALAPVLTAARPDLVVVQGDTGSALGGARAANVAGVPVAHVEAGLRSHDLRRPWPEESFRVAIDREAALLFAPTELSAANLRRERASGQIHVTGNSGIDAVLAVRKALGDGVRDPSRRLLVTCHRRENWGDGVQGVAAALIRIAREDVAEVDVLLHPNPALSTHMRQLLAGAGAVAFRQPASHSDTVAAMLGASLVLSDSGGIQEEASALGVPLLVLREKTERPEAIASGNMELVGTDPDRIVAAVRRLLRTGIPQASLPFGDGRASHRIAAIVADWLAQRHDAEPSWVFSPQVRRANA